MSSKIIITALWETLENLTGPNYEKFCHALLDRKEEPQVSRIKVEGKNALEVTEAMVSTFTESGAPEVAVQTLKDIGCNEEAQRLCKMAEDLVAQSSKPGLSDTAGSSAGASGATNMADDSKRETPQRKVPAEKRLLSVRKEFVQRVSDPILDQLLDELFERRIINYEEMQLARAKRKEDKARDVIHMVQSKGSEASLVLINALCELDRCLAKELNLS